MYAITAIDRMERSRFSSFGNPKKLADTNSEFVKVAVK